jgi:hypothetical protein
MGVSCSSAKPIKPTREMLAKEGNLQDNARSYKSKIGGMRLILRNQTLQNDFTRFLARKGKKKFIICYLECLRIKQIKEMDQLVSEINKLIDTYPSEGWFIWDKSIITIGQCLQPIKFSKDDELSIPMILKNLQWVEESLLSNVTPELEEFIQSPEFAKHSSMREVAAATTIPGAISVEESQSEKEDEGRTVSATHLDVNV